MPCKFGEEMRDLGIIENATILIENGFFKWIGRNAEFTQTVSENIDIIDASDLVGLPGFVDSHTHLLFAGTREGEFAMRIEGKTYEEIAQAGGGILSTCPGNSNGNKKRIEETCSPTFRHDANRRNNNRRNKIRIWAERKR